MCGGGVYAGNAVPVFHNGGATVDNPYYASAPEALIDRNGWFTTYDFIPTAFNNANGFAVPDVATLVVNYKHSRFSITPNLTYTLGIVLRFAAFLAGLRSAVVLSESGAHAVGAWRELQRYVHDGIRFHRGARRRLHSGSVHASVRRAGQPAAAVAAHAELGGELRHQSARCRSR